VGQPDVADRETEYEELVLRHRDRMVRAVWRVVRDADLADEALQDALGTLWRKLDALRTHSNPEAFVLRVCLDAAYDRLRERLRARRRDAPADEAAPDPGGASDRAEVREVLEAIRRLDRRQATAILLHAVHGEPYRAVAQALGCGEATARVHVQRAREKLRRAFGRRVARAGKEREP
jgi:RNA polymerase sigma-70 factor (ECF subfamily)